VDWTRFWCVVLLSGGVRWLRLVVRFAWRSLPGLRVFVFVCLFVAMLLFSASDYVTVAVGVYLSAVTYAVVAIYFDIKFAVIVFNFTLLCFLWARVRFAYAFLF